MSARMCGPDPKSDREEEFDYPEVGPPFGFDAFDAERADVDVEDLMVCDGMTDGCTWTSQRDRDAEERFDAQERGAFDDHAIELHFGAEDPDEDPDEDDAVDVEYLMLVNGVEICTHTERVYLELADED